MGKKKFNVTVDGYGKFSVPRPKEYNQETFDQGVLHAVLQTLNMMAEAKTKEKFHPVLGLKVRGDD